MQWTTIGVIIIAKYYPLALSGSLYSDMLGIVIANHYDFCVV